MRLAEDNIQHLAGGPGDDAPDAGYLRKNRTALIAAIERAKKHFLEQTR
jgi:hypothetical protein